MLVEAAPQLTSLVVHLRAYNNNNNNNNTRTPAVQTGRQ
jgi:hypothetical protein